MWQPQVSAGQSLGFSAASKPGLWMLPMISPTLFFNLILGIIGSFQVFTAAYLMTGGGPANTTQILPSYIFTTAYRKLDFGYAATISMALLLLLFLYSAALIRLRRNLRSTT